MNQKFYSAPFFATKFGDVPAHTFSMTVRNLVLISYIAVRGIDDEEGAVQRVLSKARIGKIRDYILDGNIFFNSFILNWTNTDIRVEIQNSNIRIPIVPASAQVIDGQHRITGLAEAMEVNDAIGEQEVIVTCPSSEHLALMAA
jgi:DGQHR domain-containing protein